MQESKYCIVSFVLADFMWHMKHTFGLLLSFYIYLFIYLYFFWPCLLGIKRKMWFIIKAGARGGGTLYIPGNSDF